MELKRAESIEWVPAGDEHFSGAVWFGPLSHPVPEGLNALAVSFEPGARTDWHTHAEGQVLYCVSGAGRVQTVAGETAEFGPGDVIYSPPGERHWHGAGPGSPMVHLSLTTGSPTEWVGGKVDDADYLRPPG